jgi:hypothetical protein
MKAEVSNAILIPEIIKMLNEGHTVTISIKGFSMRPFLENGRDSVLLSQPAKICKRDIVLAEIQPGHYVLHRIIRINGYEVVLRGDGNTGTEHCTLHDIKGFAKGFYRKGRKKPDKTNGLKWKLYSLMWCTLLPARRYILTAYHRIWIPIFGPI